MGRGGGWAGGCSLEVEGLEGRELREARAQQLHGLRVDAVAAAARRVSCMRTGEGGSEAGQASPIAPFTRRRSQHPPFT